MSNAHKGSNLSLSKELVTIDQHTVFLAHLDITPNEVLSGIEPISSSIYTLLPYYGCFGGGISVEESSTNLIKNGDYSDYYSGYSPNWDSSLNGNLHSPSWNDYNGGVTSANVGYHAHINISKFGFPVMEYIDENSQYGQPHRWLGSSQSIATNISGNLGWQVGTEVTYSFDMMVDGIDKGIQAGLYHQNTSSGNTFGNTEMTFFNDEPYVWQRQSNTITVDSTWDLQSWCTLYVYGQLYRNNYEGIGWVKDVQIETKSFSTSFVNGSRNSGVLGYPLTIDVNNFTINFWAKCSNKFYVNLYSPDGNNRVFFRPDNNTTINGGKVINGSVSYIGSATISDISNWHMYTISSDGSTMKMYQDGVLLATTNVGTINNGSTLLSINDTSQSSIFDEIRIDRIARSDDEIVKWYLSGLPFYPKGVYRLAY